MIHHAVAVSHHGARGLDGREVSAQETVGAVVILFIIGQSAGFKIRLPVAVVSQSRQSGVGVSAQIHIGHQVVGHGVPCVRGEGAAQDLYALCAVRSAPAFVVDIIRAGQIAVAVRHVIDVCQFRRIAAGGLTGGICQPVRRAQRGACAVAGGKLVSVGDRPAHQTCGGIGSLEARSVAVGENNIRGAYAFAQQSAGNAAAAGGVQIAVRIAAIRHQRDAVGASHQPAGAFGALDHGGGKTVGDGEIAAAGIFHQPACDIAADPDILLCFGAEPVTGVAEIDLAAVHDGVAAQPAGQPARAAAGGDVGAAQPHIAQGAGEVLEQAAVAGGIHGQPVDHRMIDLSVYGDAALKIRQIFVVNGGELTGVIQAVPVLVCAVVGKLDILLLPRLLDGRRQPGGAVQVLQMPRIGDDRGAAAVLHRLEQTVGLQCFGNGVYQTAVALHLHLDGQISAGCQVYAGYGVAEPRLL